MVAGFCVVMLHVSECCGSGIVSTIAGSGSPGHADGDSTSATLFYPRDITVDSTGNLFVADYSNHIIRRISPSGQHCFVRYDSVLLMLL